VTALEIAPQIHDLPLFIASSLLLNITPGPDTLYIAARSAGQGRRAGMVAALGVSAGCYVHILAAALGLSALLAASAAAFTALKWLGGLYLIYLGLSLLRGGQPAFGPVLVPDGLQTIFFQAFVTDVLNPKMALFFLAFLPQFVEPAVGQPALAFLFLGLVFNLGGTAWCLLVAWAVARFGPALTRGNRVSVWLQRGLAGLFVVLGVRLVAAEPY
jgi:threonine/homoserine/homoserine lactone efflux protein